MAKKLVITFDEETTEAYLTAAIAKAEAEVNADCESSGATISIKIAPSIYDSIALMNDKELGTVQVDLLDE